MIIEPYLAFDIGNVNFTPIHQFHFSCPLGFVRNMQYSISERIIAKIHNSIFYLNFLTLIRESYVV